MISTAQKIKVKIAKPDTDESVKKMLDTWDKVNCHYCGKEISMLNAKTVENGKFFVCKEH